MTYSQLVKNLREGATWDDDVKSADAIEQLTAERDHAWEMAAKADTQMGQSLADNLQAKAERDEAWAYMSALQGDLYDAIMIKAERDRLLKLLEAIIDEYNGQVHGPIIYSIADAHAALKGGTP